MDQLRFGLRSAHLWPLIALAACTSIVSLVPIDQVDFWWHVALGRDIAALGAIPTVSDQSWLLPPSVPFIYGSWLAELCLYGLYLLDGLPAIVLCRNLLFGVALGLVGAEAGRRSRSGPLAALAIAVAGLMALNNVSVRPQMFAWVLFAGTLLTLGAARDGQIGPRWLLIIPMAMIAWVNLHGSFVVGLALLGLTALGVTIDQLVGRRVADRRLLGWLWLAATLSGLAVVCNPRGIAIITFVRNLVGHPATQQFVGEWQAPDLLGFPGVLVPLAALLVGLGWLRRRRIDTVDALLLLGFGYLAVGSVRNVLWFGMLAWPIAAGELQGLWPKRRRPTRQHIVLNGGLAAILCAPLIVTQPPFKAGLNLAPAFAGMGRSVPDGAYIGAGTPVRAAEWLRANVAADARIVHDMRFGSYLIWALPEHQIFIDGRIELYPYAEWLRYRRIVDGEGSLRELDALGATHALLGRDIQQPLIALLAASDSGWTRMYADDDTIIFQRNSRERSQ